MLSLSFRGTWHSTWNYNLVVYGDHFQGGLRPNLEELLYFAHHLLYNSPYNHTQVISLKTTYLYQSILLCCYHLIMS